MVFNIITLSVVKKKPLNFKKVSVVFKKMALNCFCRPYYNFNGIDY